VRLLKNQFGVVGRESFPQNEFGVVGRGFIPVKCGNRMKAGFTGCGKTLLWPA
jgi:hypothetical protein